MFKMKYMLICAHFQMKKNYIFWKVSQFLHVTVVVGVKLFSLCLAITLWINLIAIVDISLKQIIIIHLKKSVQYQFTDLVLRSAQSLYLCVFCRALSFFICATVLKAPLIFLSFGCSVSWVSLLSKHTGQQKLWQRINQFNEWTVLNFSVAISLKDYLQKPSSYILSFFSFLNISFYPLNPTNVLLMNFKRLQLIFF